mmetsp:Transcript_24315/g.34828  ORF Transcript_24315/g.34828 Transcript_24315/m.34828 type:complete len:127 (-) Transcript_24315:110-490(-)
MTAAQQHKESLENGEPLLQSRRLSCDASRKGMPWRSEQTPVKVAMTSEQRYRKEVTRRIDRRTQNVKKSNDKKIRISSVKKVRFSHMLPDQRDEHQSPIVYQRKGSENNRRSEVAPLWYHPFQTGH